MKMCGILALFCLASESKDLPFDPLSAIHGGEVFEANEITQECRMRDYRKEMIQVAAVAVQMIECLDRNYEK